jgi:predicted NBD/HSP70 family sugar kinase
MNCKDTSLGKDFLTLAEIPNLPDEQMKLFTDENVFQQEMEEFNPDKAIKLIKENEGKELLTVDMGGDKITRIFWKIVNGCLVADTDSIERVKKIDKGANYTAFFEKAAEEARIRKMNVAISFAGPLSGTCPQGIPNATDFKVDLDKKYGGDFANLFPSLKAVNNDAQAGIKTAAMEARKSGKMKENGSLEFVIDGGGFGLAFIKNNKIIATEVGHTRLADELNWHKQNILCGLLGRDYVCIERVAASGAGVESIYKKLTGEALTGKEISDKYQNGDELARKLYENSAILLACGIVGIANLNNLMTKPGDTVVAYHGGGFRVPGLMNRVSQIISKEKGEQPTLCGDDTSINACAQGVAIAAFYENT